MAGAFGAHALSEQRQRIGVDLIRLRELSRGSGEVPHLPGIRHNDWHPRRRESRDYGTLVPARRLEDHERRRVLVQALEQGPNARLIIGDRPPIASRADGNDQLRLRDIDAHEHRRGRWHSGASEKRTADAGPALRDAG